MSEEGSDFDAMSAAWDAATSEPDAQEEPQVEAQAETDDAAGEKVEAPEKPEDEGEEGEDAEDAQPKADSLPQHVPMAVRNLWGKLDAETRAAIDTSYRALSDKMAQQGRDVQRLNPVKQRLNEVIRDMPEVADLTDEQLADGVFELARSEAMLRRDPIRGVLAIADRMGVMSQLAQVVLESMGGQQQGGADLMGEIAALKRQLAEANDPRRFQQMIKHGLDNQNTESIVVSFAETAEHWEAVQDTLPTFIKMVRDRKPEAQPLDALKLAYDMAVHADPDLRASLSPSAGRVAEDPRRQEEAKRAASLNIRTNAPSKGRALSENELLAQAFDRATSR